MEKIPNLRQQLGVTEDYVSYCREERNFAAVLYHLLLDQPGLNAFLDLIGVPVPEDGVARVYFEYAALRDLWAAAKHGCDAAAQNQRYREAIEFMLGRPDLVLPEECKAFNEFFIGQGSRAASATYIQMPSRWSDSQFQAWCEFAGGGTDGRAFAERACTLKWAFNAKPDLVLHLGGGRVVCIEAKLESGVGAYRVNADQPAGCFGMTQTALQEFILQDLLGYKSDFVIISKSRTGATKAPWRCYTWHEVFEAMLSGEGESRMVAEFRKSRFIQPA